MNTQSDEKTGNCTLFDVPEDDDTLTMVYNYNDNIVARYNRRVFSKLEAVKGRDEKDKINQFLKRNVFLFGFG